MSEITKQALLVDNNQSFPNNNSGQITAADLRAFNVNLIDSTVNQTQYNTNSGSWNVSISNLNAFTASQQPTFNALNSFTASQLGINSGVNSFTQSANYSIDALNIQTASFYAYTASINQIRSNGVVLGTSTIFNLVGPGTFFSASLVQNVQGNIATLTFASDNGKVNTSSFNEYTASTAASQSVYSASVATSIATVSASISAFSTSLDASYVSEVEFSAYSSSVNVTINAISNSTGAFATTGSNTFTGDQTLVDAAGNSVTLSDVSGSLMLVAKSFTSASAHISASTSTQVNLIFKNNSNTADTIISGSNNLFVNAAAPTAGFKRYIGGSGNIMLNASNVPLISGSMAFSPTMNNNLYSNNGITTTMRGPATSSAAWTISGNIINQALNIGTSAANNAEKIVTGLTVTSNVLNNSLSVIANRRETTQLLNITTNQTAFAATTLNAASSSLQYVGNFGGALTLNNNASGSGAAIISSSNATYVAYNTFAGLNTTITTSGSSDPNDLKGNSYIRHVENNAIFGNVIGINLPYAETGSNALNQTMIAGNGLGVTGSNASTLSGLPQNGGSAFFGRYNALDGNKAQSAQTVFAVGTGNSTTRKTGFLIDSGSNTFIEGSLTITGSVYGNVTASSIISQTASIDLSVANYFTLTLSGSANINVINPRPGITATLVINTDTNATSSFSSNVKQPSGSLYVASPSGNVDIISFTAVNSTTVYAFPAQSFV